MLIVANHFGGAADAVVLMSALSRRPQILADEKIWKVPVAHQMMNRLGAIQVRRGKAGSGRGMSFSTFILLALVFLPAAIVYLIARPASVVRRGDDQERDWRDDLMDRLDAQPVPAGGRTDSELCSRVESAVALEQARVADS